ncbi:MAG TPA: prohibitin family protein [Bacteroidota bacterium]
MVFIVSIVIAIFGILLWRYARRKVHVENNAVFRTPMTTGQVIAVAFGLLALSQFLTQIPAGHVGVVDFFGVVSQTTLKSGINLVNPMAHVIKMSVQTTEMQEKMSVLSKEGLTIDLELSVLYRLDADSAANVYVKIAGGDFEKVVLIPQFRSISRSVTASFNASALYSTERERLGQTIQEDLATIMKLRGVVVESAPLRNVGLPPQLTQAIEEKQRADQESQRMQFILQKEQQEAERKRIEAKGIADFQRIVAQGISEQLLRWKGIEATLKIAESANAKVVVIGSGKDGLPIILGGQ